MFNRAVPDQRDTDPADARLDGRKSGCLPFGSHPCYHSFMAKKTVVTKKKRGPAPTGKGTQVGERWHPPELAAIDAWIARSSEDLPRGQAIRRLVEIGLKKGK